MKRIILALDDLKNLDEALFFARELGPLVYAVKIHDLYDKYGPDIIKKLKGLGVEKVWVDHKLYDIPNTVRLRAENIEADIISVHASGGREMLEQAVASHKEIFAVTVLTSMSPEETENIYHKKTEEQVLLLASLAKEAGVSGVVCSPKEARMLRTNFPKMKIIVPGVRSLGESTHDQSRVSTPKEAIEAGADLLVIGRQITKAKDPKRALDEIRKEIGEL